MVASRASTVADYLAELPADRRKALESVRKLIRKHLPKGYKECMQYGMISYCVPLSVKPDTYNGQALTIASVASQKNYMSLYLFGLYVLPELLDWFELQYEQAGKKLDMGKSCVRFKNTDDLLSKAITHVIESIEPTQLIAMHDDVHGSARQIRKKKSARAKRSLRG